MHVRMEVEHFANSSILCYLRSVKELCEFTGCLPDQLNEDQIYTFLHHLKQERQLSRETIRNYLQGMRFMYRSVYKRIDIIQDIPYPKQAKKLPTILSGRELLKLFEAAPSIKHRVMLKLTYGGGLRRSEVINLKICDVDFKNNLLRIESGKGGKDRYTLLPKSLVAELIEYQQAYQPQKYLFNGRLRGSQISEQTIRWAFTKAIEKADIHKKVCVHSLRHSFASHLLAMGTDLVTIQKLMGHSDIRTTMVYLQLTHKNNLNQVISPLDRLQQ